MLIRVTNAINGRIAMINPNSISQLLDRDDPKYPNTKAVLVLNDSKETFIPCREDVETIASMLTGATIPARRAMPAADPSDPGPQER